MEANKVPDSPNGTYTLPPSYKVESGDTSDISQHNPPFEDVAQALSDRLHRDGRTSWTGNQNANGFKITGLAPGTNPTDAVTVSGIGVAVAAAPAKVAMVDADRIAIVDTQDSNKLKYSSLANFKTSMGLTASLGDAAFKNTGTAAGTVAAGNDPRLSDAREWNASVVTQVEAQAGTSTTARKWTAQRVAQAIVALTPDAPVGLYTGSSASATNLPVGHTVLVFAASPVDRNASSTVRLGGAGGTYGTAGAGSTLSGTWRARGGESQSSGNTLTLFQRTA